MKPRSPPTFPLVLLFSLWVLPAVEAAGQKPNDPQTIGDLESFSSLLPCAQNCFGHGGDCCSCDLVAANLGCDYNCQGKPRGAANRCYCRADRIESGRAYLSSCVKQACGGVGDYRIDLQSATSIYYGYCTSLEYFPASYTSVVEAESTAEASTNAVPGTGNGAPTPGIGTGAGGVGPDVRTTAPAEVPQGPGTAGPGSGGFSGDNTGGGGSDHLSDAAKAAIGLGVALGFALAVIAGFAIWWFRARNRGLFSGSGKSKSGDYGVGGQSGGTEMPPRYELRDGPGLQRQTGQP